MLCYYFFETAIPLGKDLAAAFEHLGHQVLRFDSTISPKYKRLWRLVKSLSKPFGAKKKLVAQHEAWLNRELSVRFTQAADAFAPELIVVIQGERIEARTVQAVAAKCQAKTVLWRVKPPRWQHSLFEDQPFYDRVLTIDNSVCQNGIEHLPSWALNDQIYYPGVFEDKERQLLFVGCHSPQRQEYLEAIAELPLKIIGNGWGKVLPLNHSLRSKLGETWVGGAALADLYRKAWAVVDIPQFKQHQGQGVNMRFADVPACGTVLITQDSTELKAWLEKDVSVIAYDNKEDFSRQCREILQEAEACCHISKSAILASRQMVTYEDRANSLLPGNQ
jgi:hypothetical protein